MTNNQNQDRESIADRVRELKKSYEGLPDKTDEERQRIAELEKELKRLQEAEKSEEPGMKVEVVEKKRFWSIGGTKEIIYSIKGKRKNKVLNCRSTGLERISNLILSPHQDKILFTAESLEDGLRNIYVVNINGKNLTLITYNGEAAYLTKPGDLEWVGPAVFMYIAPAFTSQTYNFESKFDVPHVLAVYLGDRNQIISIPIYYYGDDGKLIREDFTEEQLKRALSNAYEINRGWINRHKDIIKRLESALSKAKRKLSQASKEAEGIYDNTQVWKDRIESIEDAKESYAGALDDLTNYDEQLRTNWPKIPENIARIRVNNPYFERLTASREERVTRFIDNTFI